MIGYRVDTGRGVLWTTHPDLYRDDKQVILCETINIADIKRGMVGWLYVIGPELFQVLDNPLRVDNVEDGLPAPTEQYVLWVRNFVTGERHHLIVRKYWYLTIPIEIIKE